MCFGVCTFERIPRREPDFDQPFFDPILQKFSVSCAQGRLGSAMTE